MDASNIWPTTGQVRICIHNYEPDSPYIKRGAYSDYFTVEAKQRYHFDMALPYAGRMQVRVVNREGDPLEGLGVSIYEQGKDFNPIYPRIWNSSDKPAFTDQDGLALVDLIKPGETFLLVLKRFTPNAPEDETFTASAFAEVTASRTLEQGFAEVTFDDRPVRISGTAILPEGVILTRVFCAITGEPGQFTFPLVQTQPDDRGHFSLEAVPPGNVRIIGYIHNEQGDRNPVETTVFTTAGNSYDVVITEERIELVDPQ